MRISFQQMQAEFSRIFQEAGMPTEPAETCARIHTESSRDGIHTHGAGRVLRFHGHLKAGFIDPSATPTLHKNFGALEVWDGNFGPGILNAIYCTDRAVALAKQNGIGLVGLRNTTHWMRGGTYGLQAAAEGCALIAWTNADGSMPPWGGREARLGNNPFVMALPGVEAPLLLDISMSIYSYGKMSSVR
ncbi:MAG: Ldh family oxidoreductase, partial [Oscillospiraceae bacterium]|nr:Ldh family oxidoreductase [Oscillospiraceae bacterium]